jgi:hypothetical protein
VKDRKDQQLTPIECNYRASPKAAIFDVFKGFSGKQGGCAVFQGVGYLFHIAGPVSRRSKQLPDFRPGNQKARLEIKKICPYNIWKPRH